MLRTSKKGGLNMCVWVGAEMFMMGPSRVAEIDY